MPDDSTRFVTLLDALDDARTHLMETLDELERAIGHTRDAVRSEGRSVREHLNGEFGMARRHVTDALVRMNSALMACRAEGIRQMVDVEGMSLSEVSRVLGSSRQFVTRLYQKARVRGVAAHDAASS